MKRADYRESLEELTGDRWPEPGSDATRLVRNAYAAYTKPAEALTVEELRLLIGQQVALEWTVPFAIDELERDPLAEGDMYPGDLMNACMSLPEAYFADHRDEKDRLREIAVRIDAGDWDLAFSDRHSDWRST
ncbi:contact-dependent growth inhibition system immunity protein [Glycomyces terrestris]|uniref:Uncharacterized protein n=1 Tax=Glycomyces terrestris TaxID=2493553 RepID=A0A426UXY3_9ACTN|nr:contact-dependent growth inhibition system immunity protein [Glycomyces terrestris]RRR99429.1 hypothetical protein EIW28_12015 [Glycomyces terrestris]